MKWSLLNVRSCVIVKLPSAIYIFSVFYLLICSVIRFYFSQLANGLFCSLVHLRHICKTGVFHTQSIYSRHGIYFTSLNNTLKMGGGCATHIWDVCGTFLSFISSRTNHSVTKYTLKSYTIKCVKSWVIRVDVMKIINPSFFSIFTSLSSASAEYQFVSVWPILTYVTHACIVVNPLAERGCYGLLYRAKPKCSICLLYN